MNRTQTNRTYVNMPNSQIQATCIRSECIDLHSIID